MTFSRKQSGLRLAACAVVTTVVLMPAFASGANINGTSGNNKITGTPQADATNAKAGNDKTELVAAPPISARRPEERPPETDQLTASGSITSLANRCMPSSFCSSVASTPW